MQEDMYRGDGLNLYAYCANNPMMYYDPSGYCAQVGFADNTEDAAAVINKSLANGEEITYDSIIRALRQSDTPEGYAVASMLKRGIIELDIQETHRLGWAGEFKYTITGNRTVSIFTNQLSTPLQAARYTSHEARHYLQKLTRSTYSKAHEIDAYNWQRAVDNTFPLRTEQRIIDFVNTHPAYRHLQ